MTPRYTFKDLRNFKHLSIEKLAELTGIFPKTLEEIEVDSSSLDRLTLKILTRFYCLPVDYIFIGKQSEFEAQHLDKFMQSGIYQKAPLSKKLAAIEVAKLEKKLGLSEFSLFQAVLELSKEGENEQPT
ncbi:hypothetical protein VNN41_07315 [Lactococcus garvieae]|uniref:helix-turn-helix domain-containing protein n=1 Tax=Lactococcus garvieae TaxID=1363 RepID=UPI0032450E7E